MHHLSAILLCLFLVLSVHINCPAVVFAKDEGFKPVELDSFIEQEQEATGFIKGKKLIKMFVPVRFEAKMKRYPEEWELSYIYTAMQLAGVQPLPVVHHRMFVETGKGRIIPVYVEEAAAGKLAKGLKEEEKACFLGYHVYSYSKGPAILVVDFTHAR